MNSFVFPSSSDIPYGFWFVGAMDHDQRVSRQATPLDMNFLKYTRENRKMVTYIKNTLNLQVFNISEEVRRYVRIPYRFRRILLSREP